VTSTFPKALSAKAAAMSALVISGESDKRTPGSSAAAGIAGSSAAGTAGSSAARTPGSSVAATAGSSAAATAGSSRRKPKSQTQSALVGFSQFLLQNVSDSYL
jgi:outer membrane lipoprotein SlyB